MFEKILNVIRYLGWRCLHFGKIKASGLHAVGSGSLFRLTGFLELGQRSTFGRYNYIDVQGKLIIGDHTYINDNVRIVSHREVQIGNQVLIASGVSIYDHDHQLKWQEHELTFDGYITSPVKIGSRVWIGDKVIILKGVTIGDNVVVGAGSVVTADIPSNTIAAGNPCKVIRAMNSSL
ncbi:MAG: acyltransferase [Saprospiraceae bacterium]|nr:acyltransferase [Saprospiraceae bacterium]